MPSLFFFRDRKPNPATGGAHENASVFFAFIPLSLSFGVIPVNTQETRTLYSTVSHMTSITASPFFDFVLSLGIFMMHW